MLLRKATRLSNHGIPHTNLYIDSTVASGSKGYPLVYFVETTKSMQYKLELEQHGQAVNFPAFEFPRIDRTSNEAG